MSLRSGASRHRGGPSAAYDAWLHVVASAMCLAGCGTDSLDLGHDKPPGSAATSGAATGGGGGAGGTAAVSSHPEWIDAGTMALPRRLHAAAPLSDGRALVMGGGNLELSATVDIYDPKQNAWTAGPPMTTVRGWHTATSLLNGDVLVVAGSDGVAALASVELYDAAKGAWTGAPPLSSARYLHTATLLQNGKVLVIGGIPGVSSGATIDIVDSSELYDPATNTWSDAAPMAEPRFHHTATLLGDGRVLVAGGTGSELTEGSLATAELYDPELDQWSSAPPMPTNRKTHMAVAMADGSALILGGVSKPSYTEQLTVSAAISFDPVSSAWREQTPMTEERVEASTTRLPDGTVLVVGGWNDDATGPIATAERYNPIADLWSTGGTLKTARSEHVAVLVSDGGVVVAGGMGAKPIASAERFELVPDAP